MNKIRRLLDRFTADSSGMTLIEVIVAIAIMGIVATAAIGLAISSTIGSVSQQRRAIAVTVANAAMEKVSGLPASSLFSGRSKSAVNSSFTANVGTSGVSDTYQEYDHTLPLPGTQTVPIPAPVTQNGTPYTVTTIIGTCFENLGTNGGQIAGGDCRKTDSATYAPVTPTGYTPLTRVIVIVGWTAGQGCAVAGSCVYTISSLIDSHSDLEWKTNG
ncbi:type II secretion system protein [Frigoribacterium sp. UYMn621]|uniref:type IV pilus modification PilV family protein n=1 Tax=Frigoribacterium sp. UYMn621 TaxID=3156343 RepID=UPI003399E5E4